MKVTLTIYVVACVVLVSVVFAKIEIIGADAVFETSLQGVSVTTSVASVKKLFVNNAAVVWTQELSSWSIQTTPSPVREMFLSNADAVLTTDLVSPTSTPEERVTTAGVEPRQRVEPPTTPGVPKPQTAVAQEDSATMTPDIVQELPETNMQNPDAVAVVIGNRDYVFPTVPDVNYAVQDAAAIKTFLTKTLGYKEGNILFFENATQGIFNTLFGTKQEHKGMLFDMVKPNVSDVFIYYSGHGVPDVTSRHGYFVPVDCSPKRIKLNGYPLNLFYYNLSQIPAKSFTIVIDACFSGVSHTGSLLGEISPIVPVVENPMMHLQKAVIITAARGDEVSGWYSEMGHGLFTYFFLKGISGDADRNRNRELTVDELQTFLLDETEGVPYFARRLHGVEQHPEVFGQSDHVLIRY
jgi:hypothetical protein